MLSLCSFLSGHFIFTHINFKIWIYNCERGTQWFCCCCCCQFRIVFDDETSITRICADCWYQSLNGFTCATLFDMRINMRDLCSKNYRDSARTRLHTWADSEIHKWIVSRRSLFRFANVFFQHFSRFCVDVYISRALVHGRAIVSAHSISSLFYWCCHSFTYFSLFQHRLTIPQCCNCSASLWSRTIRF